VERMGETMTTKLKKRKETNIRKGETERERDEKTRKRRKST
jgi:hypothetical protein